MQALTPVKIIRNYEGVVIVDAQATEDEQKSIFKKNQEIIKNFEGEVNHLDTWGRRNLANPIKKQKNAIYFHMTFTASPEAVAELERTMKINDKVLRFMHTKMDDRLSITKHLEQYREVMTESINREKEREAKFQKKKAAFSNKKSAPPKS